MTIFGAEFKFVAGFGHSRVRCPTSIRLQDMQPIEGQNQAERGCRVADKGLERMDFIYLFAF